MTTFRNDSRTLLVRMPVLSLGRFRGALVLELTDRVEHRLGRRLWQTQAQAHRRRVAHAMDRADDQRTQALGRRPGGGF